jgi:hypothetical protein
MATKKISKKTATKTRTPKAQSSLRVGNTVYIHTVTYHYIGQIIGLTKDEVILADSAVWVADSGRFNVAMRTADLNEYEQCFSEATIKQTAIVTSYNWKHPIPNTSK